MFATRHWKIVGKIGLSPCETMYLSNISFKIIWNKYVCILIYFLKYSKRVDTLANNENWKLFVLSIKEFHEKILVNSWNSETRRSENILCEYVYHSWNYNREFPLCVSVFSNFPPTLFIIQVFVLSIDTKLLREAYHYIYFTVKRTITTTTNMTWNRSRLLFAHTLAFSCAYEKSYAFLCVCIFFKISEIQLCRWKTKIK